MLRLIGGRLATGVATLLLITLLVFGLLQAAPGDPLADTEDTLRGFTPEQREALRRQYRLDLPWYSQYAAWLGDLATLDLGRSFRDRRPVAEKIVERLPVTLSLNAVSLLLMVLISVPLGAAAALRPGGWTDRSSQAATLALYAIPTFWAGLLLQLGIAASIDWIPLYGIASTSADRLGWGARMLDRGAHMVLPVICLSYGGVAYLSRFVRSTLLDGGAVESTLAARARGLSAWAVLVRHGFRLASVPMLTLAGLLLPGLVAGSVVVEAVFNIPGIGLLFFDAARQRDLPTLLGLTLMSGVLTLAGIVLSDLAYAWFDPRTRRA